MHRTARAGDQHLGKYNGLGGKLEPGDLLFFRVDSRDVSHVAIYTGNGTFVHAPQSGKSVETRTLDDDWYRHRLVSAGRLY